MPPEIPGGYEGADRRSPENAWIREFHDRVSEHGERLDEIDERLKDGANRMDNMGYQYRLLNQQVKENTEITKRIDGNTAGMVEQFRNLLGFSAVMWFIFRFVLGASAMIIAIGVIYWFVHTGELPRKP